MADVDPPLGKEILDVAQRQRVPHVHHHDQTDHFWRAVEVSERVAHSPNLPQPELAQKIGLTPPAVELGVPRDRINTIIDFAGKQEYGVKAEGSQEAKNAKVLAELAGLVASGDLDVPIAATFRLDDVREAFRLLEQEHTRGKIVLLPKEPVRVNGFLKEVYYKKYTLSLRNTISCARSSTFALLGQAPSRTTDDGEQTTERLGSRSSDVRRPSSVKPAQCRLRSDPESSLDRSAP